jgi:cholesterol oxidase
VRQDVGHDWLVIGSGFGGSVAALRLAEKGHRVSVLECGRRFADHELPRSTWDLRRYFWAPKLGFKGIFRLTIFRDVAIVSGSGVGGGSLGYGNTLYRAPERFYADPQWSGLEDWSSALAPHFDTAERMLGVVTVDADDPADLLLREFGEEIGADRSSGVIDARQRVFGYENLLVCDGSAIPANVGVNPSSRSRRWRSTP